jgi:hypothetical protein
MRPPDLTLAEWRAILDLYERKIEHGRRTGLAFADELEVWETICGHVRTALALAEETERPQVAARAEAA